MRVIVLVGGELDVKGGVGQAGRRTSVQAEGTACADVLGWGMRELEALWRDYSGWGQGREMS